MARRLGLALATFGVCSRSGGAATGRHAPANDDCLACHGIHTALWLARGLRERGRVKWFLGVSGLLLWFPTFFAKLMPGWLFNTHMRPEKFPMDPVIFTGRLTEHELRDERPDEYDQRAANGGLAAIEVGPSPSWVVPSARVVAAAVVSAGFVVVILIVLTLVQGRG